MNRATLILFALIALVNSAKAWEIHNSKKFLPLVFTTVRFQNLELADFTVEISKYEKIGILFVKGDETYIFICLVSYVIALSQGEFLCLLSITILLIAVLLLLLKIEKKAKLDHIKSER